MLGCSRRDCVAAWRRDNEGASTCLRVRAILAYSPGIVLLVLGVAAVAALPFTQPVPCHCPAPSAGNGNGSVCTCTSGTEYDPLGPLLLAAAAAFGVGCYLVRRHRSALSVESTRH